MINKVLPTGFDGSKEKAIEKLQEADCFVVFALKIDHSGNVRTDCYTDFPQAPLQDFLRTAAAVFSTTNEN